MSERFEYQPRTACICGQPLAPGSKKVVKHLVWGDVNFVSCLSCGSWCQSPEITVRSITAWYESDAYQGSGKSRGSAYFNYLADEPQRVAEARRRYHRDLAKYLPPHRGRILEIGCATGSLLKVLRDAGHEVFGIDLSSRFAKAARQYHGLDVQVADVLSAKAADSYFDMILLFGTISNLSDIPGAVRRIHALLKPNGILIANFPMADSAVARLYGASFWMFAPSVNTLMTKRGFGSVLARSGFSILKSGIDFQAPSLHKLFNHAKCSALLPALDMLGLGARSIPFRIPVPGVNFTSARKT